MSTFTAPVSTPRSAARSIAWTRSFATKVTLVLEPNRLQILTQ